jgi:hypothetical protein
MTKSNNILLVLSIVLLLISAFGTFTLLSNITFETPPAEVPKTIQTGEIRLSILPDPGSDSATGYVGLTILPEE